MNFTIRKYKKNDEIGIMNLDNSLLTHKWNKRNLKNWYWKYKNGISNSIIVVAEYKKKIIGHFAVIPIYYSINKKKNTLIPFYWINDCKEMAIKRIGKVFIRKTF